MAVIVYPLLIYFYIWPFPYVFSILCDSDNYNTGNIIIEYPEPFFEVGT